MSPAPFIPALAPPHRSRTWYAHPFNHAVAYRLAHLCVRGLPRPGRRALAAALGRVAYWGLRRERECVRRNLARVLPDVEPRRRAATAAGVFRNFGCFFADLLTINRSPGARLTRYLEAAQGIEHLDAATNGRGLVVATAHLGNWEFAGRLLAARRPGPVHVVLAREEDPAVESFLRRDGGGVRFVTRATPAASLGLLAALRRGETVAVQGDRATGERTDAAVPFFGAPAPFPLGPFILARAAGARVLPAFCLLGAGGRYRVSLEPPIEVAPGGEMEGLRRFVQVLERYVAAHPDQWFTFYDFWGEDRG